ncbi:AAA family ATPase [Bradyrhizobium stylosanthis]|uniref:AAA family ATPase n=1 Tax=Bradyrhizobium stylosanthis TaxID=1803665 RepID=UPI0014288A03|nr:AAA family ATPase [Bradyrhizobium stylosanthis]
MNQNKRSPSANQTTAQDGAAAAYVKLIHKMASGVDGKLVVSAFHEEQPGVVTHHNIGNVNDTIEAIAAHSETPGANVYMPLCVMRRGLPRGKKGSEADVVAVLGLVADMDADTNKIGEMPIEPSYVVETSPGNSQQVILFDEPLSPEEAKPLAIALKKASGSDHGTADISHVWRIPGTLNWPTKTKLARGRSAEPFAVRLKEPFQGRVYSGSQLSESLSDFVRAPQAEAIFDERFSGQVDSGPLWDRASDILRASVVSDGGSDRSEHAASVFEHCAFEGLTLDQTISLCLSHGGAWKHRYRSEAELVADAERCWNKFILPREAEREENARAAKAFVDNARRRREKREGSNGVTASPFVYQDPATLPRRDNLYGGHFIRRYVSATFGGGGGGKSSLEVTDLLGMICASPPLRAWYLNLEDPYDEMQRRVTAAALHHGIDPRILNENLFMDSGRDQPLVVMTQQGRDTRIVEPVVKSLIAEMKDKRIDVLIIDPFVSTHEVEENDNNKIQQVANQFARIANEANASVELVHHINKASGDGKSEVTADSGRGAGALKDKARAVRAINTMSEKEAEKAGIDPKDRFSYFRVTNVKSNMSKRSGRADWYRIVSVDLGNGTKWSAGDSVGVVEKWQWPSEAATADEVTKEQLDDIKRLIGLAAHGDNHQAKDWAGRVFGEVLGLDPKGDKRKIGRLMKALVKAGHFVVVERKSDKGRQRPMFEVAPEPHHPQGGVGSGDS